MRLKHLTAVILGATTTLGATAAMAELKVDAYGSLRIQAENVNVGKAQAGEDDSYTGLRDAYSRFGVAANYPLHNGTNLGAKIEIPFNSAALRAEDPSFFEGFYKDNNAPRVAKLTADGDWGGVAVGMQWLTYYNHIAYPVDYFSSFYSGFATHAKFRREAVTYNSPNFAGFSFSVSGVDASDDKSTEYLDTMQYAASYQTGGLSLALALEDVDDKAGGEKTTGFSAAYTLGSWRFAGKLENREERVKNKPENLIKNIYASYNMDKYTFKAHYAIGDDRGAAGDFVGDSLHLGTDYQYTKNFKVFVEYFAESNGYAIYDESSTSFNPLVGYQVEEDGQAVVLGARYDF